MLQPSLTTARPSDSSQRTSGLFQPGQTVIVTVGGQKQTITIDSDYPQMTSECGQMLWTTKPSANKSFSP